MFRIPARLGKICVGSLDSRVLVAVTQLIGQVVIAVVAMFFVIPSALGAVRIVL
jgi:hypothetical protein